MKYNLYLRFGASTFTEFKTEQKKKEKKKKKTPINTDY